MHFTYLHCHLWVLINLRTINDLKVPWGAFYPDIQQQVKVRQWPNNHSLITASSWSGLVWSTGQLANCSTGVVTFNDGSVVIWPESTVSGGFKQYARRRRWRQSLRLRIYWWPGRGPGQDRSGQLSVWIQSMTPQPQNQLFTGRSLCAANDESCDGNSLGLQLLLIYYD